MLNNTDNLVLQHLNNDFVERTLPCQIILGLLIPVGTFGNISVIVIFMKHYKKTVFRVFVVSLAVVDTINCSFVIASDIYIMRHEFIFYNELKCKILSSLKMFLLSLSAYIMFALSVDRYKNICRPLKWQFTTKMAKIACVVFMMISSVSNIATYFGTTVSESSCLRQTGMIFRIRILAFLVPSMVGLTVIYILIGRRIYQHQVERSSILMEIPSISKNVNNQKTEKRTLKKHKGTKIAFVICFVYILSYLPTGIITILINSTVSIHSGLYSVLFSISRLYLINSVANPIIYGFLDIKFRRHLAYSFYIKRTVSKSENNHSSEQM